jgi:hypothetical protein
MMTVLTELNAISLTGTAAAAAQARGVNLAGIVALAKTHVIELQRSLANVLSYHPNSGGDSTNYAALQAIVAELA